MKIHADRYIIRNPFWLPSLLGWLVCNSVMYEHCRMHGCITSLGKHGFVSTSSLLTSHANDHVEQMRSLRKSRLVYKIPVDAI